MRTGRPIPELILSGAERESLENWARRPKSAQALALRARMILRCAEGLTNTQVAGQVQVRIATVGKWRQRFVDRRLDGLLDEARPGAPRKVSDADVERALTMTLESTPKDATHWSTRSLAKQAGLSRSTVGRIWRARGENANSWNNAWRCSSRNSIPRPTIWGSSRARTPRLTSPLNPRRWSRRRPHCRGI